MKRRYDLIHAIILISFLVIANFIGNAIIKGILLLLFAIVLTMNTVVKLRTKNNDKFGDKVFYGVLLFLDCILMAGAIYTIVFAVTDAM
jgi:hypothetical protein